MPDHREGEQSRATDSLELNKETLQDLDVEAADADQVKGGVSASGLISASLATSRVARSVITSGGSYPSGVTGPTGNTVNTVTSTG